MQTVQKFKQFVDEISLENGRNYKLSILEKYKDDENIKYYLNFVFNPYITTGISDKKLNKDFGIKSYSHSINQYGLSEINIKNMLNYLSDHNTGTDEIIRMVQGALENIRYFSENAIVELCKKIITKNLQLGVDSKTINKVISNLIPEFNVMLANKYFDNPKVVNGKEFILTTKIDGCRIVAIKENGEVSFYTRQGQKYEGLVDLESEMKEFMPDGIALDGELTLLDKGNLESGDQYKATTKICRTKDLEKHGLKMLVFDAMKASQFREQKCETPYYKRRAFLENQFAGNKPDSCKSCNDRLKHTFIYFDLLPTLYHGTDVNKIEEILNEQVANGEEGIMINIANAAYQFKRTNDLLKCKLFNDIDLDVIDFEEGTNSNKGRLGALICKYNDSTVKVGSGFSEELRNEIWANKDMWIGRTITIKYFEESYDSKTKQKSLRFPIYLDYRTDK